MTQLRGIVMCGGQSKRMGTDKGLIPIQSDCWAAYMADKLRAIDLPVSISINSSQIEKYQMVFDAADLIIDSQNIDGPLNGLLSAHAKYPDDDLLLLACDMINMRTETLNHLVTSYQTEQGYDYYVYQNQQFAEPFCGIYTSKGLNKLMQKTNPLNQANLSFQKVLNEGNTKRLQIIDIGSFDNYNRLP